MENNQKETLDIKEKCPICGTPKIKKYLPALCRDMIMLGCNCDVYQIEKDRDDIKELLSVSGIPEKYIKEDLSNWIAVPGTEDMYNKTKDFIRNMELNISSGNGIMFAGIKGTGKTKCCCAIGLSIIKKLKKRVRYISLTKFIIEIDKIVKSRGDVTAYVNKYINVPILILDDVGESSVEAWYRKWVFLLLDGRNNKRCVTVINTMQDIDILEQSIGDHNVSRIREMAGTNAVNIKSQVDMRIESNIKKYKK